MMNWTLFNSKEFGKVATQWDSLNQQSINQPILDSHFIQGCLTHFGTGDEIIARCQDAQGPLAIGIFQKAGFGRYQTFQPSQAPLGLWLVRHNRLSEVLVKGLKQALPGAVLLIDFLQQETSYLDLSQLTNVNTCAYITTGRLDIPTDYNSYFANLGKNMRQNYHKVINRSAKNKITLETKLVSQPQQMLEVIEHFGQFESSGWKGRQGTAVNLANSQGQFYHQLLVGFARRGLAEAWYYLVDRQVVATDLCIKSANTLIILKTAYNEEYKKLSPALQLKFEIFKHHSHHRSETGINAVEFFGKAMVWHKRLHSDLRAIEHITWCSNPVLAAIYRRLKSYRTAGLNRLN